RASAKLYTLSLHDALPICKLAAAAREALHPMGVPETKRLQSYLSRPLVTSIPPRARIIAGPAFISGFGLMPARLSRDELRRLIGDRKSTRLNSSHVSISYA